MSIYSYPCDIITTRLMTTKVLTLGTYTYTRGMRHTHVPRTYVRNLQAHTSNCVTLTTKDVICYINPRHACAGVTVVILSFCPWFVYYTLRTRV